MLQADRFVHIAGGARMEGEVLVAGAPVVNRPVRFDVKAGDQGTIATDNEPLVGFATTDEDGVAFATFKAPLNPAFEGDLSHPQMIVGAGEEVGNP